MKTDANKIRKDHGAIGVREALDRAYEDSAHDDARPNGANSHANDGKAIIDSVYDFLGRFVAYPSEAARIAHALWIIHTHLMEAWESTPRIAFLSPEPGSGKTRALEISQLLVPRPVEAVNVTPAYLFRKVADPKGRPTILFDEIDTVFGPAAKANEEIRAILNAGHRRGAVAGRCIVRGKRVFTEEIPAFCAVALAGIGDLPDTILSRCIQVQMRRRSPDEVIEPYRRRDHAPEGEGLRDRIAAWASTVQARAARTRPAMPTSVTDRNADVWESLLAIADLVGGDWPQRSRAACVTLVTLSMQANPSLGVRLLSDIRTVFGEAESRPTESILTGLIALPESPWADIKGKPLNDRGLAARLRRYEIKPKVLRIGTVTSRGYDRGDFLDAWKRYLPRPPIESVTSVTSATCAAG
jgi:hypothetical protein